MAKYLYGKELVCAIYSQCKKDVGLQLILIDTTLFNRVYYN